MLVYQRVPEKYMNIPLTITGWWCNNHLEKYEFVNGKDYPIYDGK